MKYSLFGLLLFLLVASSCADEQETSTETNVEIIDPELGYRPNIVWLVAEDLSPVLPQYGDSTIQTHNLSRLAEEGVVYDHFYTPHPVCAPARAAIITGMYANRIAASHMRTGPWYSDQPSEQALQNYAKNLPEGVPVYEAMPQAGVRMFTTYLREAGYYCTNNAKQDYQFRKTPAAWDESSGQASWKDRKPGQPFFAVFNFNVCHESRIWVKAEDSLWVDEDLDVPVPPYLPDTDVGRSDIRRMYSNVKEMDYQVGQVLQDLEEDGLLDSTIVIWYSDHGGPLPRQKRALFDSGVKVPMIIRFPGKQFSGSRDDRMISFIDLGPTMLSLAGLQVPPYMDGTAFLGEAMREEEPSYVFGAADRFDEITDRIRYARDKRYKYIRNYITDRPHYKDVSYRKQMPIMQELLRLREENSLTDAQARWFRPEKAREELYDLLNDPYELNNLVDDPEFNEKLMELSAAMDQWLEGFDDTGLIPEADLITHIWPDGNQPVTRDPELNEMDDGSYEISSPTEGASLAYKVFSPGEDENDIPWEVYDGPVIVENGMILKAVAHRIGFLRSEIVEVTP